MSVIRLHPTMIRLTLMLSFALLLGSAGVDQLGTLNITITNIPAGQGEILLGLISEENKEGFPENSKIFTKKAAAPVTGTEVTIVIKDIPPGTYAFSLLHDTNGNKQMDKSFFGLPEEGYAFSNNFKPTLSAPDFEDCAFTIKAGSNEQSVKLIH